MSSEKPQRAHTSFIKRKRGSCPEISLGGKGRKEGFISLCLQILTGQSGASWGPQEEFLFLKTLGMEPNADELQVRKGAVLEI